MVDRHATSNWKPAGLGRAHHFNRSGAGNLGGVITGTGQFNQAQIAFQHDHFSHRRNARKPKPRGRLPGVHYTSRKGGFLNMLHHQHVKILGVGEGATEHVGVAHSLGGISYGDGTSSFHQTDLAHQFAVEAFGDCGHRGHAHQSCVAGATQHVVNNGGIIDYRLGVGHHNHSGDTTGGCGFGGRGQGLTIFGAGFAREHPHIDQAGN